MGFLDKRRGYDVFEQREKEIEEKRKSSVYRFWLPPEKETKIIFLDDNPVIIDEHQLKIGGSWKNWKTCLSMIDKPCPICEAGNKPSLVGYYTILDLTEWTDSNGNVHKNEIKLFGAKMDTLKKLKRASMKLKERGKPGLVGAMFEVYRSSASAVNTGDDFDYIQTLTMEEIKKLNPDAEPIDYEKVLQPESPEELRKLLKQTAEKEFEDGFTDADFDDEEIPF